MTNRKRVTQSKTSWTTKPFTQQHPATFFITKFRFPSPLIYPKWTNTSSALQFSPFTAVKHQHGFPQHYYPQLRFQLVPPLQALKTHQIPTIHAGKTITIPTTIVYQLLIQRPLWQKNGLSPCPVGKMLVRSFIWYMLFRFIECNLTLQQNLSFQ